MIFSDVSAALLEHIRADVDDERASFVETRAEDLAAIPDASVDIVTTRSVLIYVDDKPAAFSAMRRVLRPGGRISLFEPINSLMFPEPAGRFLGYDVGDTAELAGRVSSAFVRMAAMVGFDDRDLLRLTVDAGFERVHIETHADIEPYAPVDLDTLLDGSPNPLAPTIREQLERVLDAGEQARLIAALETAMAAGPGVRRVVAAYVSAQDA